MNKNTYEAVPVRKPLPKRMKNILALSALAVTAEVSVYEVGATMWNAHLAYQPSYKECVNSGFYALESNETLDELSRRCLAEEGVVLPTPVLDMVGLTKVRD